MKFQGTVLLSENINEMAEFYEFISNEKGVGDDSQISFESLMLIISDSGTQKVGKVKCTALMFRVENIRETYNKLKNSKYEDKILNIPTVKPWGVISFQIVDPDGYKVTILRLI